MTIRMAITQDIPYLVKLENQCFTTDRLSRRNFHYLLTKAHAATWVAEEEGLVLAYLMLLFSRGTSAARLYSIAVNPTCRRQGLAGALLHTAEQAALAEDYVAMRLEIREDNDASRAFFQHHGYKPFGVVADYYEDHHPAIRYEKVLAPHLARELARVPFYRQTLEFTCGPAALIMAMSALEPDLHADRRLELRLWREATTVFMTSGHGGCGPYGLALAAFHRGFRVELFIDSASVLFIDSVRHATKKAVMRLVEEDFLQEIAQAGIPLVHERVNSVELREKFSSGGIPLVLISSYRIYRQKFPHWVVVTGFDDKYIYVHDPYVHEEVGEAVADCVNMPILQKDFERMARYGKTAQRAVVVIYPKEGGNAAVKG